MKNIFLCIFCLWGSLSVGFGQTDSIWLQDITSVSFHKAGIPLSLPIIQLNRPSDQLVLTFDLLGDDDKEYTYHFSHCNKDWKPSNLSEAEYLEGSNDRWINDYNYSSGTYTNYVNYQFQFPNDDVGFLVSGNYILTIKDASTDEIALTQRFMVVEPLVQTSMQVLRANGVNKLSTHQLIELKANFKDYPLNNPVQNVSATLIQNRNWRTAKYNIKPYTTVGSELSFDFDNSLDFPGLKEFRYLDIRNDEGRTETVESISEFNDGYEAVLRPEKSRANRSHHAYPERNGSFVIYNHRFRDVNITSDYMDVSFMLKRSSPYLDRDVYVVGGFSQWQLLPQNKLTYDEESESYTGWISLKQGIYDYLYATKSNLTGEKSFLDLEGSSYETENRYDVLLYLRQPQSRYDRLISHSQIGR